MATTNDVASRAGVGIGTESRVVNDNRRVRPETRAIVPAADRACRVLMELPQSGRAGNGRPRRRERVLGEPLPFNTG